MKFNITATIVHHHYKHSDDETKSLLKTIIKNQNKMSQDAQDIKDALTAAQEKVTKIAADVQRLNDAIAALSTAPTAAELQEIKDQAKSLNDSLQAVDDTTPE